jgi:DtxR family transcriptional regulator, Mn-dependent transcriptional regulator
MGPKNLSSNMEDYLEAILSIQGRSDVVRVRDIAEVLKVKRSSVTAALATLSDARLVVHEKYGHVELTPQGSRIARNIQKKHDLLVNFLTKVLQVEKSIASVDACKLEHEMSPETFQSLSRFIEFIRLCPDKEEPEWLRNFKVYIQTGKRLKCKKTLRR